VAARPRPGPVGGTDPATAERRPDHGGAPTRPSRHADPALAARPPRVILRAVAGSTVATKSHRRGGSCDFASLRAGWHRV